MTRKEWMDSQGHLPGFMKDFHDQKDLFKTIETFFKPSESDEHYRIPWVKAQIYVIDKFLWFMAIHGYTLQKTRTKIETLDVHKTLGMAYDERMGRSAEVLKKALSIHAT